MTNLRSVAMALAGLGLTPATAFAQAVPVYAESASDSLARNMRILAEQPHNFMALLSAGKAALEIGDAQSAAGFFGRAEELDPNSPLPKAGMGAALVATGDPNAALTYFARAQDLGASPASLGCDRGMAYDLLGNQVAAQTDYRAALAGPDRDEARRRLALSLAISGDQALALETLQPLLARQDSASWRVRALVLAVGGNLASAKAALDSRMPGASSQMEPFFRRLPALSRGQKAAAVHLGLFPDGAPTYASASIRGDRLESIEQFLTESPKPQPTARQALARRSDASTAAAPRKRPQIHQASVSRTQLRPASSDSALVQMRRVPSEPGKKKIWLQLASETDASELPERFNRIRARKPSLFEGISGHVAAEESRARLVIGPFHSEEDARLFADALSTVRIDSRRWVSEPGEVIRKLETR